MLLLPAGSSGVVPLFVFVFMRWGETTAATTTYHHRILQSSRRSATMAYKSSRQNGTRQNRIISQACHAP